MLHREDYRRIAARNAEFISSTLYSEGRLHRSFKNGRARLNAYLEDYACLVDGLISTYEATFDPRWIHAAQELSGLMVERFWDSNEGGFYFTSNDHESLIHRPKDFYDNATPSGNSVAVFALLRLWKLTGEQRWADHAIAALESMTGVMPMHPSAFANWLCTLDFCLGPAKEIAISGNPVDPETIKLLNEVFRTYLPNKVVACGVDGSMFLLENRPQIAGHPTAYVCENFSCRLPVNFPEDLSKALSS